MKIGLITYHSAYNFGSVLQAYATQKTLENMGHDVEIINYRMRSQKNFYSLFPIGVGKRAFINHVLDIPTISKRKIRAKKYEDIIHSVFNLTSECNEPEDLAQYKDKYDIYVSGSDQIISCHSNELAFSGSWLKFMGPYLLNFTEKKKISYASSPNLMSDEELGLIKNELQKFSSLSCREEESSEKLSKLLNKQVHTVLDPTLLLEKKEWIDFLGNWENSYINQKYIFYYVLKGTRALNKDLRTLSKLAAELELKIITVSPLSVVFPSKNIINVADAAVYDFLGLIKNAEYIITDSYHGTLFSVNFEKNFYSLQTAPGINKRVEQMADRLGFRDRVIYDLKDIDFASSVDYKSICQNRGLHRKASIDYLERALEN